MKTLKAIQITWNGQPLKKVYPYATQWQVFKYRAIKLLTKLTKIAGLIIVSIGLLILTYQIGIKNGKTYQVGSNDNLPAKIAEFKASALAGLSGCEAPGYTQTQAPIILDTNKKMSIGPYMFQVATVQYYYKTLYNQDITPLQATLIALDYASSTKLTSDILFNTNPKDATSNNWYNCANKTDLVNQLKVIKQLES